MSRMHVFGCALMVALTSAAIPVQAQAQAQTQTQKKDSGDAAKRAKCFEAAQAAAAKGRENAEKNELGSDAYHECARKAGIRP